MEKTAKQIEKDLFHLVNDSVLETAIKGKVYRDGTRPVDATTEDIVVKFLTGIDGQEQNGVVLIHIYVPDLKKGDYVENITRIAQLEVLVNEFVKSIEDNAEYFFEKDGTPKSFPVEGIKQHFINVRIKYRRKSF